MKLNKYRIKQELLTIVLIINEQLFQYDKKHSKYNKNNLQRLFFLKYNFNNNVFKRQRRIKITINSFNLKIYLKEILIYKNTSESKF